MRFTPSSSPRIPLRAPSVQAQLRMADYAVHVWCWGLEDIDVRLRDLLRRETVIRRRMKKGRMTDYDLRPLIVSIDCERTDRGRALLLMRLRCGPSGSGRPEEILDELGLANCRRAIRRTRVILADQGDAQEANHRRKGA